MFAELYNHIPLGLNTMPTILLNTPAAELSRGSAYDWIQWTHGSLKMSDTANGKSTELTGGRCKCFLAFDIYVFYIRARGVVLSASKYMFALSGTLLLFRKQQNKQMFLGTNIHNRVNGTWPRTAVMSISTSLRPRLIHPLYLDHDELIFHERTEDNAIC